MAYEGRYNPLRWRSKQFITKEAHLFHKKSAAQKAAATIRKEGRRAVVEPTSKTTQKRSPQYKWVVFEGQVRKRRA